jgi:ribosomal protein S24E
MELNIKNKKDNPLLKRQEVTGELTFVGAATPSNKQLLEELTKKLSVAAEVIVVKHIYGAFGGGKATFEADVYASKEQLDKIEPKKKVKAAPAAPAA